MDVDTSHCPHFGKKWKPGDYTITCELSFGIWVHFCSWRCTKSPSYSHNFHRSKELIFISLVVVRLIHFVTQYTKKAYYYNAVCSTAAVHLRSVSKTLGVIHGWKGEKSSKNAESVGRNFFFPDWRGCLLTYFVRTKTYHRTSISYPS